MSSTSTSNIGLGSLTTSSSGSTSLSSTLFGIDINELVDNLVEAKSLVNVQRQDKIDTNTAKLSGYSELESLLTTLKSSADALKNPTISSGVTDAFDAKQTLSTASGSIDASKLFGISAADTALNGNYSITINRIAKTDTISGTQAITDSGTTSVLAADGALYLNGQQIDLTSSMTLSQIKDAINNKSSATKVTASIVQAGTNDYRLVLKSTQTGDAIDLTGSDTDVLTALGITASGATDTSLSAELVLDGVTVTRSSNSVNDLISGLSIQLYQADPGNPIAVSVDSDLSSISDSIASFLTAYNAVVDYVQAQRAVGTDGTVGEDQVLYNDNIMISTYRSLQSIVGSGALGLDSGTLKGLRDIGIDLDDTGRLVASDTDLFENNLLENLDQIRALFGFSTNSSTELTVVNRPTTIPSSIIGQSITVRVTATDSNGQPTAAEFERDGIITAATVSGGFIRGATGTEYEGLVIGYTGSAVSGTPYEGTIKLTQGIADQISGMLDPLLKETTGTLAQAKEALTSTNTRLETQISDYENQLDLYRDRLLLQFQAAQEAIAALESQKNSILSYVDSLNSGS